MNSSLRILLVSAYYKNDQPGGLGVTLQFNPDDDGGVEFCKGLENCLVPYDRLSKQEVLAGLKKIARERPESRAAAMEVIAGVHWLQSRGHLVSDEFNGTMFNGTYEHATLGNTLVNSEVNPVTIDLDAACTSDEAIDLTSIVKAAHPGDPGLTTSIRAIVDHARKAGGK